MFAVFRSDLLFGNLDDAFRIKALGLAFVLMLAGPPEAVHAQGLVVGAITQTVANAGAGLPEDCLSLKWQPSPKAIQRLAAEAEPALQSYLKLAALGANTTPAFKRPKPERYWALDGEKALDVSLIHDPWVNRVHRVEQLALVLAAMEVYGHGAWRAYDANNQLLGTYEARLVRKTKGYALVSLDLWSPGQEHRLLSFEPFCGSPGDHEEWLAAKVAKEARKKRREENSADKVQ